MDQLGRAAAQPCPTRSKSQHLGAEAQSLDEIARDAGTQVAGAGARDHRIHLSRRQAGIVERTQSGFGGEPRGMLGEAPVQRVGIDVEDLVELGRDQMARRDPVVAQKHLLDQDLRPAAQAAVMLAGPERLPALGLAVALRRRRRPEPAKEHGRSRPVSTCPPAEKCGLVAPRGGCLRLAETGREVEPLAAALGGAVRVADVVQGLREQPIGFGVRLARDAGLEVVAGLPP